MGQRIALYGGCFDPIHHGHLIVARAVAERLDIGRVVLLPTADPPHKRAVSLTPAAHRAEMIRLAIRGEGLFELSDYDLTRPGPTYTLDTVRHFRTMLGAAAEMFWIIGADSLAELPTWHRVAELVDACRIVTACRPGWEAPDLSGLRKLLSGPQLARLTADIVETPRIDISATDIRRRVAAGWSIRYLVPDAVAAYIAQHGLYRAPQAVAGGPPRH